MTVRRRVAAGGAAALIGATAGGFVWLRGGSTPVPLDATVDRFRSASRPTMEWDDARRATARPPGRPDARPLRTAEPVRSAVVTAGASPVARSRPLPPAGVYRYETTGYDEVDALGGSRHTYPRETTITVRHAGCGLIERWDALDERWDERESCRSPRGDKLARVTSYHEFFRHADERTLRCNGLTYPSGAQPGDTWTMRCDSDTTKSISTLRAVGYEDVVVEGRPVRTLHVRVETRLSGEQHGEGRRDVWGARESGLVVRERSVLRSESTQPALGRVTYHEEFELRLSSLDPAR